MHLEVRERATEMLVRERIANLRCQIDGWRDRGGVDGFRGDLVAVHVQARGGAVVCGGDRSPFLRRNGRVAGD